MSKSIVVRFGIAVMLTCGGHDATAITQTTFFDTLNASTSVVNSVNAGDTLFVDTLVRSETGALSQSVTFSLGGGVTGMTGLSAWMVSTAAGAGPRLVGFNIDLFDASTNALIASDTAPSVSGGVASSSLAGLMGPGTYTLVITGTGVRDSLFDIALSFTGTPPQTPSTGSGALPAQGPVTSDPTVFSNVLVDTRTISSVFGAGDTMILDTLVTSGTGPLSQSVTFTLGAGVDSFGALAAWAISTAAGPGPRLVGVNIDLFDSTHTLIASDGAVTVVDGVARSTFAGPLGPGTYTLVATGTGLRDSSLDMAVSFGGAAIPEPATLALLGVGLAGFAMARRRKPA